MLKKRNILNHFLWQHALSAFQQSRVFFLLNYVCNFRNQRFSSHYSANLISSMVKLALFFTIVLEGIFTLFNTHPAAITQLSPTTVPFNIVTLLPIHTLFPIHTRSVRKPEYLISHYSHLNSQKNSQSDILFCSSMVIISMDCASLLLKLTSTINIFNLSFPHNSLSKEKYLIT